MTAAGTTCERLLKSMNAEKMNAEKMNAEKKMGMKVISAKDHGESFLMPGSIRALAFMVDDALHAGNLSQPLGMAKTTLFDRVRKYRL